MKWKAHWPQAKANLIKWWAREGLALSLTAPRREPIEDIAEPPPAPDDAQAYYSDPAFRSSQAEHQMARTCYLGEAFPYFDTKMGPGTLGKFLGARPRFTHRTVWYDPCIEDPETFGPIRFTPAGNEWWDAHLRLIDEGLRRAEGRYLVGVPDLVENLDTLAAMRGSENLLMDLVERPAWVADRLEEICEAFMVVFEAIFEKVRDPDGGNAFSAFDIWGPGKTAKLQCDISCMISPGTFRRFVVPTLRRQCDWLDYCVYHLDGEGALHHLDALLEIDSLDAIQWTPGDGNAPEGSRKWYGLYRRVRAAGKGLHVSLMPQDVIGLIDTLGPEGLFIRTWAGDEESGERLLQAVRQYR